MVSIKAGQPQSPARSGPCHPLAVRPRCVCRSQVTSSRSACRVCSSAVDATNRCSTDAPNSGDARPDETRETPCCNSPIKDQSSSVMPDVSSPLDARAQPSMSPPKLRYTFNFARVIMRCECGLTTQAQRRRPRDAPIATATARRRPLQRMVEPTSPARSGPCHPLEVRRHGTFPVTLGCRPQRASPKE